MFERICRFLPALNMAKGVVKGKGKNVKSKPKTQPPAKRQNRPGDTAKFSAQLAALGLRIVHVTADGNCFFRAIADQLEGDEEEYTKYRQMVVEYIMKHREDFEPFVEDDMPFDEYCRSMQEDGTWAGHMELQAASLVTQTNICIHRHMSPRWHIRNFDRIGTRTLHLSYHDGEHYNSIRLQNDDSLGPAQPIVIEEDDNHARPMEDRIVNSGMPSGNEVYDQALVKLVMVGTGCTDAVRVCQVLQEVYGDADAAIEFLIAEKNASICSMQDAVQSCSKSTSNGGDKEEPKDNLPNMNASPRRKAVDQLPSSSEGEKDGHERGKGAHNECVPSHPKVSRNNPCPCGSKKKYKACCEAARQKSSAKIMISREISTIKTRKQKVRNEKSELQSSSLHPQSRERPPDLGGLYI